MENLSIFGFEGKIKDGFFYPEDLLGFYEKVKQITTRSWGWGQEYNSPEGTPHVELHKTKKYEYERFGQKFIGQAIYFCMDKNECFVDNQSYREAKKIYSVDDSLGKGFKLK